MMDRHGSGKRLRVGIDLRSADDSGVGRYIRHLVSSLLDLDCPIEYVFYLNKGQQGWWNGDGHVTERRVSIPKYSIQEQTVFPRLVSKDRLDVFHIPFYVVPLCYAGKLVVTIYDLEQVLLPYCVQTWPAQLLIRSMIRLAVHKADQVITISENTRQDLMRVFQLTGKKIHPILLDSSPLFREERKQSEIDATLERFNIKRPYILNYTGKWWKLKNTEAAVRAFVEAKRQFNLPHQLVVVGRLSPEGKLFFENRIPPEYRHSITRTGFVEDKDLAALYSATEVFLYLSRYEGFGFPPVEAMVSGAPVISSPCGSLREVLGDAAMYVGPDDIEQIARAISDVVSNSELRSDLVERGRKRVKSFSWSETARKTVEVYRKVCGL